MLKTIGNVFLLLVVSIFWQTAITVAQTENLTVKVYKSEQYKAGYVRIGLDALRAFEVAFSHFKERQKNHEDYDSIVYAIEGDKIIVTFLKLPTELDGKSAFRVILDRKTFQVLNKI